MRNRLMAVLDELECFEESGTATPDELMAKTDELIGAAHEAIEKLYDMMKGNDQ